MPRTDLHQSQTREGSLFGHLDDASTTGSETELRPRSHFKIDD